MTEKRRIELLSPARDLECGLAAIEHGADAVYIGAPRFGARAAAGNSLDDIARLVERAHLFNARVYVTVNTIIRDDEMDDTHRLIWQLYRLGVDALIVQDVGITRLDLPPIPLHASTQMDNRSAAKVRFLRDAGYTQVVLARELSLAEVAAIHREVPDVALEAFVHGALCVSYSGQCYASCAMCGRSANRGECAQICRLPYDLVDADGHLLARQKHLLSLRDLNLSGDLEALLDAGVTSLKIEGRLKDAAYVKNITAFYRQRLDVIIGRRDDYVRASSGSSLYTFTPQADKSFSRGFTTYMLHGRGTDMASHDTPKSMGEPVGTVKEQRGGTLVVAGTKTFHNGDGICFLDYRHRLQGFRVNRVEGNRLQLAGNVPPVRKGTAIYRNHDQQFSQALATDSAMRKISLRWTLAENPAGYALTAADEDGNRATMQFAAVHQEARTPQADNQRAQLQRLGGTSFEAQGADILTRGDRFIPSSQLAEWRRCVVQRLTMLRRISYRQALRPWQPTTHAYPDTSLTYLGNVMNTRAEQFYRSHGVSAVSPAYERQQPTGVPVMFCKYCIRHAMGWCPRQKDSRPAPREPLSLIAPDGRRLRLHFDCRHCQMLVYSPEKP